MTQKKKTTRAGKTTTTRRTTGRAKQSPPRAYRMPRTAAELKIDCALCHAPAVWFDYGRGTRDHRAGFVCDDHEQVGQREKLLVRDQSSEQAA